jgi:hypothetical protein
MVRTAALFHPRAWMLFSQPRRLEQEPSTALGLVDPNFKQACGGNVAVFAAQIVRLTHARHQLLIVVTQFGEHVQRRHEIRIVVLNPLQTTNVTDRTQRGAANFAYPLLRARHARSNGRGCNDFKPGTGLR